MSTTEHPVFGPLRPMAAYKALTRLELAVAADSVTAEIRRNAAHYAEYADSSAALARC